jgi:hypothetical protein
VAFIYPLRAIPKVNQVMRTTLPKIFAALAFLSPAAPAFADNANAGVFAEWLSGDQPDCIPLGEVNKAADGSVALNGDQFQFVRASGRGPLDEAESRPGPGGQPS